MLPLGPRPLAALGAALAPCLGCVAPAPERELPVALPDAFSPSGAAAAADRWWTAFEAPELDATIDEALDANPDLEAVWQRLVQARATVRREDALRWPDLTVGADATWRRPEPPDGDTLGLGLASSWELDLWGRIGAAVEAEELRARAGLADYRAAALTLAAEVARVWLGRIEARRQIALLDEQVATNATVLELIEARFAVGLVRRVDLLRQRQLVEATRTQRIEVAARARVLDHLLAVLLGRSPTNAPDAPPAALPEPPPLPDAGVPAELLARRPDVVRARALLLAADRDVAAAVADRWPRLTLTGSLSTADDGADALFEDWLRSLSAGLVLPLVDAGERRAEVERREAAAAEALATWSRVALDALREVEDTLVLERAEGERSASLEAQLELADRALEQLRNEYLNGVGDYIDVLTALTEQQRLRREVVRARLTRLELRVALYRALAGGFETDREVES